MTNGTTPYDNAHPAAVHKASDSVATARVIGTTMNSTRSSSANNTQIQTDGKVSSKPTPAAISSIAIKKTTLVQPSVPKNNTAISSVAKPRQPMSATKDAAILTKSNRKNVSILI